MRRAILIATMLIASVELLGAQDRLPANKTEAPAPAPPALKSAPPDKIAPVISSEAERADTRAEATSPELKMDTGADKKVSPEGANRDQDEKRR